jgi:CheY-like chemotaxis protein
VLIDVSTEATDQPGVCALRIAVTDTGPGVPKQEAREIFKRFNRGRDAEQNVQPGVGLGLAIASTLVELMGGMIGLEMSDGGGSTFWFRLELPEVDPESFETESQRRSGEHTALPAGTRLLLVEDNTEIREFAAQLLCDAGCETFTASNGDEALRQLMDTPVDLILMDCKMPIMDGYETTEELRRLDGELCRTPVVALTAYALDEERERCFAAGMNDYLTKPFSRAQLFATIARNLPT